MDCRKIKRSRIGRKDRKLLTAERLLGWHAALFPSGYSGLQKIRVGRYRGKKEIIIAWALGHRRDIYETMSEHVLRFTPEEAE